MTTVDGPLTSTSLNVLNRISAQTLTVSGGSFGEKIFRFPFFQIHLRTRCVCEELGMLQPKVFFSHGDIGHSAHHLLILFAVADASTLGATTIASVTVDGTSLFS